MKTIRISKKAIRFFLNCFILIILISVCGLITTAKAAVFEDFTFSTSGAAATLTAYEGSGGSVTIPGTITDNGTTYTVTAIGGSAFAYNQSITSVTIPSTVTSIGDFAFSFCPSLTSISIPFSVISIGVYAFSDCAKLSSITFDEASRLSKIGTFVFARSGLTAITIPDSVTELCYGAFYYCTSLQSITIPNGITSIGDQVFDHCDALVSVDFEDGIELSIFGECVFAFCLSLKTVALPDSLTSSGEYTFDNCASLSSVSLPQTMTCIDSDCFRDCTALVSIELPDSIKEIQSSAFLWCTALSSVKLPDNLTKIGRYAFQGCIALKSITIPENITYIGDRAFYECSGLSFAYFMGRQPQYLGSWAFDDTASDFNMYYRVSLSDDWQGIAYSSYYMNFLLVSQPFCIVTLDMQDGCEVQSSYMIIDRESRLLTSVPDEPSREGYDFGGWYKDSALTTVFDFSSEPVSSDITLFPRLIPGTFKINGITLYNSTGEKTDTIPMGMDFKAQVFIDIPVLSDSSYYVILAVYSTDNRMIDKFLIGPSADDARILSIKIDIDEQRTIGKIKAIVIDDRGKPLAQAVEFN